MQQIRSCLLVAIILFFLLSWHKADAEDQKKSTRSFFLAKTKAPISNIAIINIFPHDPESFTQGLVYHQGYLYESTGLNGKSVLKKMEIKTGRVIKRINLGKQYFGEGLAILNNNIYQLTWQNQTCLVYDLSSFRQTAELFYTGEGWGLTTDGKSLIMSNGTHVITYINPQTFQDILKIHVKDGDNQINKLNELEFIRGEIWANVLHEDVIARISPQTGEVLGWIDLSKINSMLTQSERKDVLNGIAYDPDGDRLFITGKFWPKLFEIKVQN